MSEDSIKFTVFDKETAKEVKKLLRSKRKNFIQKKTIRNRGMDALKETIKEKPVKKSNKMTKEQKAKKKAERTPEAQANIDARMAKLRALRLNRKK